MPEAEQPTAGRVATGAPRLSVIVPVYNERRRLERTLAHVDEYAGGFGGGVELLVVDDGSTDGTAELAERFEPRHLTLRVLGGGGNRGKGHAVRRGMLEAAGEARLMCDADESTPIEEVEKLLPWLDRGYGVAIGSRAMPEAQLDPPQGPLRRFTQWLFGLVRRRLMLPTIRDSQCGFKCFSAEAAREVFTALETEDFAFDCEALALAERFGYPIKEVGVLWREHGGSTVRLLTDGPRVLRSLLRIRRRLARLSEAG